MEASKMKYFRKIDDIFIKILTRRISKFINLYIYMSMMTVRTNNVLYGGCTVARDKVCIKWNHCYPAIFSL